jgi:hypothetical protein
MFVIGRIKFKWFFLIIKKYKNILLVSYFFLTVEFFLNQLHVCHGGMAQSHPASITIPVAK